MAKITGIGGVTIDRIGIIPRIPQWDDIEYISEYSLQQGGMVATAMMTVARLGGSAEFVGGVGDDPEGELVMETFRKAGIDTARVKVFPGGITPFSFVLVNDSTGERTIIHNRGVQREDDLGAGVIDLTGTGYLHLDGFWINTVLETVRAARRKGVIVTCDPSSSITGEMAEKLFPLVDYLMPSMSYARGITGLDDPREAAESLMRYNVSGIIITRGSGGLLMMTDRGFQTVPAHDVEVVDTTGAGDVFHGAFIFGLSRDYDIYRSAVLANAAAALKCTRLGGQAGIPTLGEVETFLHERGVAL